MKKYIIACLCICTLCLSLPAQIQVDYQPLTFGIKAGVNLSSAGGDIKGTKSKIAYNAGITVDYAINPVLYILTGLEYTVKGYKYNMVKIVDGDNSTDYQKTNGYKKAEAVFIQLPVYAAYKLDLSRHSRIVTFGGPYAAYGISGKTDTDDGEVDTFGDKGLDRLDFGIGFGGGIEVHKVVFAIGCELGLANLNEKENKVRMANAYFSMGYKF
ncbi:outer membrane beta-barrel protein [Dysgonomonas sp. 511]|uniref:outer membrane beta-barrel protein n=1 Tax=Dysgonomonas sp. 511 TaxID=2302930 RepID=UPI0013D63626|nr:outer membrane beta-barrel protein [Dysgonomonas sp. 511]NDV79095.1 hypothetical protein [Dysgonomonas sp. 511]